MQPNIDWCTQESPNKLLDALRPATPRKSQYVHMSRSPTWKSPRRKQVTKARARAPRRTAERIFFLLQCPHAKAAGTAEDLRTLPSVSPQDLPPEIPRSPGQDSPRPCAAASIRFVHTNGSSFLNSNCKKSFLHPTISDKNLS